MCIYWSPTVFSQLHFSEAPITVPREQSKNVLWEGSTSWGFKGLWRTHLITQTWPLGVRTVGMGCCSCPHTCWGAIGFYLPAMTLYLPATSLTPVCAPPHPRSLSWSSHADPTLYHGTYSRVSPLKSLCPPPRKALVLTHPVSSEPGTSQVLRKFLRTFKSYV